MPPPDRPADDHHRQRLLDAATDLVEQFGLSGFSMETVAQRAGVSRATMYRRFADRAGLVPAVVIERRIMPYLDRARLLPTHEPDLGVQLTSAIKMGVFELPTDPVLAAMFDLGFREASRILGSTDLASLATESLRPMLEFGRQTGQLRDGLDVDAVSEWLLRELFALIDDRPWTSTRLRNHIDRFVLPTLLQPQADGASSVAARLAAMEAKLDALSALVQRSLERER